MTVRARARGPLEKLARRLAYRTYPTAKAYYQFLLRQTDRPALPPLLVYTMGKVGSQTVVRSLEQSNIAFPIFHVHMLTNENLERVETTYRERWTRQAPTRPDHIWRSQYVRRRLAALRPGMKTHVVTLVRDPIARNISSFFEVADLLLNLDISQLVSNAPDTWTSDLTRLFLERFRGHVPALNWFDKEFKTILDLDVYALPFASSKGYQIYENKTVRALVLRVEDLNSCAAAAFGEFVGLGGLVLINTNRTEATPVGDIYRRFVNAVKLPRAYASQMYDSRLARHFYSSEEIAGFTRRWVERE